MGNNIFPSPKGDELMQTKQFFTDTIDDDLTFPGFETPWNSAVSLSQMGNTHLLQGYQQTPTVFNIDINLAVS